MSNDKPMTDMFPDEMGDMIGSDLSKLLGFPITVEVTEIDTRVVPEGKGWSIPTMGVNN